jgi:hypothetical protein|tara:strand:+ start:94 stop:564 length:471 start_codon:yes stop_codon:yes gene_type:complete
MSDDNFNKSSGGNACMVLACLVGAVAMSGYTYNLGKIEGAKQQSLENFATIAESEQTMQLLEGSDGIIQQVAGKYSDYLRYAIIGVASLYATSVYKSEDEKSNYTNIAVPLGTLIIMQILATFFIDNAMTKALLVTISCAWFLLGFIANILPIIKA